MIGLLACLAAVALTLSQSPVTVAMTNTDAQSFIGVSDQQISACQRGEALPKGTTAIRLRSEAFVGPRVVVTVRSGGRLIAHGERGAGWTAGVVTMPVHPLSSTRSGVELCFTFFLNGHETAIFVGEPLAHVQGTRVHTGRLYGRLRVEYLRPSASSWWSLIPQVARRMGLGRAWSGTWVALFVLGLMGSVALLCSRLVLGELR